VKRQVPLAAVVAGALVIAAAVGFFLLVKPKMDESSSLDEQIGEFQVKVDTALAAQRSSPSDAIEVADLFRLTKAMPDAADMPGMILELNGVAEGTGVEFLSITPQAPVAKEGGYQAVPIKLTFEGNYYDLTDFIFRLRNLVAVRDGTLSASGRLFTLDALDMHEASNGFPAIQAALTVNAYAYLPAAAVPPAASTTPTPTPTTTTTPAPGADPAALGN